LRRYLLKTKIPKEDEINTCPRENGETIRIN